MTTLLTEDLIARCHAGSRAKGFWDETPPQGQQLMLVVSELAESLEAHRKGYRADKKLYEHDMEQIALRVPEEHRQEAWARAFVACYKDTVEDELADAYIRLCDFIGGFKLEMLSQDELERGLDKGGEMPENFGQSLLEITSGVVDAYRELFYESEDAPAYMYLSASCIAKEKLCLQEGIDLATHIDLKLRFNESRPAKHGKAY